MPSPWSRVARGAQQLNGIARASYTTLRHSAHPVEDGTLRVQFLDGPVEMVPGPPWRPAHLCGDRGRRLLRAGLRARAGPPVPDGRDAPRRAGSCRRVGRDRWRSRLDRFMRRLGFADIAGRDLAATGAEERELLAAYSRGVNEGIVRSRRCRRSTRSSARTPEPWHPEHTMLLGRFVLFSFASNWDTELVRERLLAALGPRRAAAARPGTAA